MATNLDDDPDDYTELDERIRAGVDAIDEVIRRENPPERVRQKLDELKERIAQRRRTCWLCAGLGGIAVHEKWSAVRQEIAANQAGYLPLWTAHEYPSEDAQQVWPCPACTRLEVA